MNEKSERDSCPLEASPAEKRNVHKAENYHYPCENYVDIDAMIRSLQRAEGHLDCFRKDRSPCEETECAWRVYCVDDLNTSDET